MPCFSPCQRAAELGINDQHKYAELTKRASFDLRCDKVKITPIKEDSYMTCMGNVEYAETAGVTCKDQQATYELIQGRWIMNSESRPAEGQK